MVAFVSVLALIFIIRAGSEANKQADARARDIQSLKLQTDQFKQRASEVKEGLTAEQLQTLQAAHALVDRKRFSWSRLFADLEAAMPASVRVTRISVGDVASSGPQTSAELNITVIGRTSTDVTNMIAGMSRAGVFEAVPLSQRPAKEGRDESGTEWSLRVYYRPGAGAPIPPPGASTAGVVTTTVNAATPPTTSAGGRTQ